MIWPEINKLTLFVRIFNSAYSLSSTDHKRQHHDKSSGVLHHLDYLLVNIRQRDDRERGGFQRHRRGRVPRSFADNRWVVFSAFVPNHRHLLAWILSLFLSLSESATGRTFGAIKKFQTALLPIMYKLGVISAVIFMTLFLAFKAVVIGKLILLMNLVFFAVKIGAYLKLDQKQTYYAAPPPAVWAPPPTAWGHQKDVHLHIHNGYGGKNEHSFPYSTIPNVVNGWQEPVSAEPQPWATYGGHGRSLDKEQFLIYPSNARSDTVERIGNSDSSERNGEILFTTTTTTHSPMVVTGQTRPVIVPPIASYRFRQNRK